ncbi:polysaccharide biosynthesis tyrosine autokinase [bacterium]|nr:polysaccharide biosynthesis tyrosine autokinase [candidate division CSSED10-310 bacterium]
METNDLHAPFQQLFLPLRRHFGLLVLSFFIIVGTVAILTFSAQKIYEAKADLYIGSNGRTVFDVNDVLMQKYLVKNQIPILKSRRLAADVVRRFQESTYYDSLTVMGQPLSDRHMNPVKRWLKRYSVPDTVKILPDPAKQVEWFRDATKISEQLETNHILLMGYAPSPGEAAFIVNTWVDAYLDYDRLVSQYDVSEDKNFIKNKLDEVSANLSHSEQELTNFQKREKTVSLDQETKQLVLQLSEFEKQYNQTTTDLDAISNQLSYLNNQLDETKKGLVKQVQGMSNPMLQELRNQMAKQVADMAAYEAQLIGAGIDPRQDSRYRQLYSRLRGVKKKYLEAINQFTKNGELQIDPLENSQTIIAQIFDLETEKQSLNAKAKALRKIVDEYSTRLAGLPQKSQRLAQLERDVQVNRDIYVMLRQKYEETRILENSQTSSIRVVDRANIPLQPVYPKVRFNLVLAAIVGLLIGLGFAFGRSYFEDTVLSPEEIKDLDVEIIGVVPKVRQKMRWRGDDAETSKIGRARTIMPYLMHFQNTPAQLTEAYRTIRTYMHHRLQTEKCKTLIFTSPGQGEGKSTTAANLAIASARMGIKTLLVDCDLRKPVLDVIFTGAHRKQGLTLFLGKRVSWKDAVRETAIYNLDLLPAGPSVKNASELIGSKQMHQFFLEVKKEYKIVIFDCPPTLPVTDALVLAEWADGIILIGQIGVTSRRSLQQTLERFKNLKSPLWGLIFTGVPQSKSYRYDMYDQ